MVNGYTALALTKLDILDDLDEIKVGIEYVKNGVAMKHYPSSEQVATNSSYESFLRGKQIAHVLLSLTQEFAGVTVQYLTLSGWKSSTVNCRHFEELPANAKEYVLKIEELLGVQG